MDYLKQINNELSLIKIVNEKETIDIINVLENNKNLQLYNKLHILSNIIDFYKLPILIKLKLDDNEFDSSTGEELQRNLRLPYIVRNVNTNKIYNLNPFDFIVNKQFNTTNRAIVGKFEHDKLYLLKGGIITGEYFTNYEFNSDIINDLNISDYKIKIDVHEVFYMKNGIVHSIYVIDHKSLILMKLYHIYNLKIEKEKDFKNINLRSLRK